MFARNQGTQKLLPAAFDMFKMTVDLSNYTLSHCGSLEMLLLMYLNERWACCPCESIVDPKTRSKPQASSKTVIPNWWLSKSEESSSLASWTQWHKALCSGSHSKKVLGLIPKPGGLWRWNIPLLTFGIGSQLVDFQWAKRFSHMNIYLPKSIVLNPFLRLI